MANCGLTLTTGDQLLQTSGSLLTQTADCSAPTVPTRYITWAEHAHITWKETTQATWAEHTHIIGREGA